MGIRGQPHAAESKEKLMHLVQPRDAQSLEAFAHAQKNIERNQGRGVGVSRVVHGSVGRRERRVVGADRDSDGNVNEMCAGESESEILCGKERRVPHADVPWCDDAQPGDSRGWMESQSVSIGPIV